MLHGIVSILPFMLLRRLETVARATANGAARPAQMFTRAQTAQTPSLARGHHKARDHHAGLAGAGIKTLSDSEILRRLGRHHAISVTLTVTEKYYPYDCFPFVRGFIFHAERVPHAVFIPCDAGGVNTSLFPCSHGVDDTFPVHPNIASSAGM